MAFSVGEGPTPDVHPTWHLPEFVTPGVPPKHRGQGSAALAVRNTAEVSGKLPTNSPVATVSEPLAGAENVFCTQVDVPAFEIGRYGPKTQPVSEQCRLLPVWAAVRPLTVSTGGLPARFIWVSAPAGVGPSATVEVPPPTLSPPQVSAFRTLPCTPPLFTAPHVPPAGPVMKLRTVPNAMVVDVVLVLVDELVVVARLVLVDELVVVVVLVLVDELVVVARLVVVVDVVVLVDELVVVVRLVLVIVDATVVLVVVETVELVLLELVVDVVELGGGGRLVDVVVAPGQPEKSIVHCGVQTRNAPVDEPGQVAPPNSFVSHSSPGSRMPLPHRLMVVLVVVETTVELVVLELDVLVLDVVPAMVEVVVAPGQPEKSIVH